MGFECYRIGDLLLDAGTQEVSRDGNIVPIPRLSFRLLLSLARHAPNVVTIQQLEQEVWAGLVVDRGTVNKRVLLLRKALNGDRGEDPYIAVVRGSGYRLIVPVERVSSSPDEPPAEKTVSGVQLGRRSGGLRTVSIWVLGIVALLALVHGIQIIFFNTPEPVLTEKPATEVQVPPVVYSQNSVAVLPFVDLSDRNAHQYLGDGISEEVINLLAGMDGISVAARTSSFAFRDSTLNAMEIAQKLKVGTILEGSIRHSGNRVRVTAQLIDTQSGYHIWSKNYDRAFEEVFEVQDDIASNIAQSLKLTLDENQQPDSGGATTGDMEAFALYLKGRELFNDRIHLRAEGLHKALDYYSQAAERDPDFARAHAAIASVNWLLTSYDDSLDEDVYFDLALTSANLALELDPNSTEALAALASIHAKRGEIEQAVALLERIRVIGTNDSDVIHWEAMLHIRLGYFEELIDPLTEVYRLDPFNEHIGWVLATSLNFSSRPLEATAILKELKHFSYRQYVLGLAAINNGNYPQARELLRDTRMRSGVLPAAFADLLIDALENPTLVEEAANKVISAVDSGELTNLVGFESLLILGSPRAFDIDIDPRSSIAKIQIHAQVWNNWAVAVRQDPRFKDWIGKLGYPDFWRKHGWPDRCRPTGADDFECI